MDALLDALKTFATITEQPLDRHDLLFKSTAVLRRAHKDIDQLRSRGVPDYDGWEARLCALAGREYELRRGTNTRGQYSKAVSRETACEARDMLVDGMVQFRNHADADVAAASPSPWAEGRRPRRQTSAQGRRAALTCS